MNYSQVIIIGGGPAGISAGIQLIREGLQVVLIEKKQLGGRLSNANLIENYPGFNQISGEKLAELFVQQVNFWKLHIETAYVTHIESTDHGYKVHTHLSSKNSNKIFACKYIILATGTKPKKLLSPELSALEGKKVFYEVKDIPRSKNRIIAILGSGDIACDYALQLSATNEVFILAQNDQINALELLEMRVKKDPKVKILFCHTLKQCEVTKDKLQLNFSNNSSPLVVDFLLIAIGSEPQLPHIDFSSPNKAQMELRKNFFAVGDVAQGIYRQVGISIGDGIKAAMMILEREKEECISHENLS